MLPSYQGGQGRSDQDIEDTGAALVIYVIVAFVVLAGLLTYWATR